MGDFNINILNSQSHQSMLMINPFLTNRMFALISKPTRITCSTATLIDNIFTNNLEQSMSSGILYTDLSDHLLIFKVTRLNLDVRPLCQKRLKRLVNLTTIAAFRSLVHGTHRVVSSHNSDSTNDSYDTFSSLLMSA